MSGHVHAFRMPVYEPGGVGSEMRYDVDGGTATARQPHYILTHSDSISISHISLTADFPPIILVLADLAFHTSPYHFSFDIHTTSFHRGAASARAAFAIMARPKQGPRKAWNKWTHQQRLTLHLIHTRFSFTPAQRAKIFNSIFADDLRRCGYTDGLGVSALTSQYGEITKQTPSAVSAWRGIVSGPADDDEAGRREEVVREIEEAGQRVLGFPVKGRKGLGRGLAAHTTTRAAKNTTAAQDSYNNPSIRFVNTKPGDLATRKGYETPASSAPGNFNIRRHTVGFTDGPEDDNNITQTPTARSNANMATRPSVMKRNHEGLSRCNPSTPTTSDAAELADSGNDSVSEPLRKQRRITAADFKRPVSTSARLSHDPKDEDDSNQNVELASKGMTASRESPEVVVPTPPKRRGRPRKNAPSDGLPTPPCTPRTPTKRTGPGVRKPDAIHPYTYPSGNVIYLTKSELEETQRDLVPVAEEVAHPPLAGLLFR